MIYVLALASILALGFAACVALEMRRERLARLDRIARATRPVHGRPIQTVDRIVNRVGDN